MVCFMIGEIAESPGEDCSAVIRWTKNVIKMHCALNLSTLSKIEKVICHNLRDSMEK
jgi:hypothetical protein